jgi:hypothetical protein
MENVTEMGTAEHQADAGNTLRHLRACAASLTKQNVQTVMLHLPSCRLTLGEHSVSKSTESHLTTLGGRARLA